MAFFQTVEFDPMDNTALNPTFREVDYQTEKHFQNYNLLTSLPNCGILPQG